MCTYLPLDRILVSSLAIPSLNFKSSVCTESEEDRLFFRASDAFSVISLSEFHGPRNFGSYVFEVSHREVVKNREPRSPSSWSSSLEARQIQRILEAPRTKATTRESRVSPRDTYVFRGLGRGVSFPSLALRGAPRLASAIQYACMQLRYIHICSRSWRIHYTCGSHLPCEFSQVSEGYSAEGYVGGPIAS